MVSDPAQYVWSSYQCHALVKSVSMSTPHDEYLALRNTDFIRQKVYRSLFQVQVEGDLINDIRMAVNRGLALGGDRFKDEIEQLCKRRVIPAKMSRPRKYGMDE